MTTLRTMIMIIVQVVAIHGLCLLCSWNTIQPIQAWTTLPNVIFKSVVTSNPSNAFHRFDWRQRTSSSSNFDIRLHASVQNQQQQNEKQQSISVVLDGNDVLAGVKDFETWFQQVPGSECLSSITHQDFGNLRGLGWKGSTNGVVEDQKAWMKIPKSIVLQSDFSDPDWDVQLALDLWGHVISQSTSSSATSADISGYVALLTRGWEATRDLPTPPPSTAQDSLRHWMSEEKELLLADDENPAGRRLLNLLDQQNTLWRQKYESVRQRQQQGRDPVLTWEQFVWSMEVVHSRAFCGDFGLGGNQQVAPALTIAAPLLSAITGYTYYVPMHGQQDVVLIGLAVLAGLPSLINVLSSSSQSSNVAVLLPLIDSANHREDADSVIEYDPLQNAFTLNGGPKCLVDEEGDSRKTQLYISYGKKKDTECLINYGFLPGSSSNILDTTSRRQSLAETFLARNKR